MRIVTLLVLLVAVNVARVFGATYPPASDLEVRTYQGTEGSMPYRLFVPRNYDPTRSYPLVVFLHGFGEKGTDNQKQLAKDGNGSLWLINSEYQQTHPLFFCAPQTAGSWGDIRQIDRVRGIVLALQAEFAGLDPERVVVTGLSLGGQGSYKIMAAYPELLAGTVPMQGPQYWDIIAQHKTMNIWHFHAADDNSGYHPIGRADYCVKYLRQNGLNVVYTRYDTGGHGIWRNAYKTPPLIDWIYSLRRGVVTDASPFTSITTGNGAAFTVNTSSVALMGVSGDMNAAVNRVDYLNAANTNWTGPCSGTSAWTADVPLRQGENRLVAISTGTSWCASYGGNTTSNDSVVVTYDPTYDPGQPQPVNHAPTIGSIWADPAAIQLPISTTLLSVAVSDEDGDDLQITWNLATGPAAVTFSDVHATDTAITFAAAGDYEVAVTVSDGKESVSDSVIVCVLAAAEEPGDPGDPPVDPGTLTNVALNRPVTVDSVYNDTYVGSKAVDGDTSSVSSRWLSANTGQPHWIEIDLQEICSVSRLRLWTGYASHGFAVANYEFQAWDGQQWVALVTVTDNQEQYREHDFTAFDTDRVRLLTGSDDLARVYELEVFGCAATPPPPPVDPTNVVLNKPVTVDSTYNSTYVGDKAVDGNHDDVGSRWLSNNSGQAHWIEIDLQGSFCIQSARLWTGYRSSGFAIANYELQAWSGSGWTSVVTVADNAEQYREHAFEPVTTTRVRLLCGAEDLARLYEIEIDGVPAAE